MPRPNPFLLITMLFWGFNFVSLKIVYSVMEPGAVLFWRYFVMGAVLVTICVGLKQRLDFPKEHRVGILLAGLNSMGIYMVLFMEGVKRAPAGESAIILATNPIMVGIITMLLGRETKSWLRIVGSIIALLGVGLVVLGRPGALSVDKETSTRLWGDFLLLLSSVSWAASVVIAKPISAHIRPLPLFTMSMLGGLPIVLLYGWSPALNVDWNTFGSWQWINLAQITFGSGVIAMVCYYRGVADLPASVAALHQFLVPVIATVVAAIVLHERLAWIQGLGLAILFWGISVNLGLFASLKEKRLRGSESGAV